MNAVLEQEATAAVPEYLADCLAPLGEDGAGEDPRHGDRFFQLRQELERIKDRNMDAVRDLCLEILREEGKDLRAASWLAWPLALNEGASGLADALDLLAALIRQHGDRLYPRKPAQRAAALAWLQGNKPRHAIEQALGAADAGQAERLVAALSRIRDTAGEWLGETIDWLLQEAEARRQALESAEAEAREQQEDRNETTEEDTGIETQPSPNAASSPARTAVESESDFNRHAREMLGWLEARGELLRAVGLRRGLRWSGLRLPPAEQGRTRIPPPRAEARRAVSDAFAQGRHEEVLRLGEGLFMEPGGHLWLELQYLEHEAARALGRQELAALLASETAALLRRLPPLARLGFEDGTPFAGPRAADWLAGLQAESEPAVSSAPADEALRECLDEAERLAAERDLAAGLTLLQQTPTTDAAQALRLRLGMVGLCLAHGQEVLAAALLDEAESAPGLAAWQPGLAFELARLRRRVAQARAASLKGAEAEEWRRRADAAWRDMCRLDAAQAARIA